MEGPSLRIAKEQLAPFKKEEILSVSGNTKVGKERLNGLVIKDIFSWGKHLVFQFDTFAMRVHFMLFGTFEAVVEDKNITGDYVRSKEPRLKLKFSNGTISMFNCSIKYIEGKKTKKIYDFSIDIMSKKWNSKKAYEQVEKQKDQHIADVLLDQSIFAGVGNIIKNEVLSITRINPERLISSLSPKKIKEIIDLSNVYSYQFYRWRKRFVLRKHFTIYQKKICPHCQRKITRMKTGKRERWSYYCSICQK